MTNTTAELAIRMARAAFNRALETGDLLAIQPILGPNVMLVTGTDSAVLAGKKAQLQAWKREFAASPRVVYTRTPHTIQPSAIEPVAMELGTWAATCLSQTTASGSYSAKWRNLAPEALGPHWTLEAEIFVTLA